MTKPALTFGLNAAVPDTTTAAWGARLIVTQDGYTDFLADRTSSGGDDLNTLFDKLEKHFTVKQLRDSITNLLFSGEMETRVAQDFTLYDDNGIKVVANTNASAGYCYVAAFLV